MLNLEVVGEGATTKIYRDGNKAIKLYINASPDEAENEAKRQVFAIEKGLPVPPVYGVRKLDESTTALDMAYIPGSPLMREKMSKVERDEAIQTLVRVQCQIHAVKVADGALPKQKDRLTNRIETNPYFEKPVKEKLLSQLQSLDTSQMQLCHGDLHPLNILYDGEKHWIIDWVDATAGNPLADACRTYLIFKQYITRLAGIYLRLFCKEAGVKKEDVLAWLPVIAAARMVENMDDKMRAGLMEIALG
ncbi:MAG: phosphotransferase [Defluviitaleaceae bacterium]|nr:phosphotransferase [Defluviitaleaceae bacterium]